MLYGEPTIRKAVLLAINLISASNPHLPILDTLSKYHNQQKVVKKSSTPRQNSTSCPCLTSPCAKSTSDHQMFLVLRNYLVMLLSQGSSTGLEERLREEIDSVQAQEVFEIDLDEDGPLRQE